MGLEKFGREQFEKVAGGVRNAERMSRKHRTHEGP